MLKVMRKLSDNLPSFVNDRISLIQQRTGIERAEIIADYIRIFKDPFVQNDWTFDTDNNRHRYSIMLLWTFYIIRPINVLSARD